MNETNTDFVCFNGAKEICGKTVDSEFIAAEILKDKIFYDSSGGGVTLSGGEPLYQPEFAIEIMKRAKENGIHTAIETCGFVNTEIMRRSAALTDLFLYDYKETDPLLHKQYTGADNSLILKNLSLLNDLGAAVILRCPIIPGYNDREEHFSGIAATANRYKCIEHIEVEPYHSLGEEKCEALGKKTIKFASPEAKDADIWIDKIQSQTQKEVKRA